MTNAQAALAAATQMGNIGWQERSEAYLAWLDASDEATVERQKAKTAVKSTGSLHERARGSQPAPTGIVGDMACPACGAGVRCVHV